MSPVNTDELELALMLARQRVLKIQIKLHRWARDDPHRRFDDLFNLVADPGFLLVAWDRVSGNKGAATAGVDRRTASSIAAADGVEVFLDELRSAIKDRSFCPLPVRERMIPKAGGKLRRLGIPTDRSGGPGIVEVGVGADLRGGFLAVFLRLPSEAPGS
jgi:RNA-directed DNA polymerase